MAGRLNLRTGVGARALLGLLLLAIHLLAVDHLGSGLGAWQQRTTGAARLQVVYIRKMSLAEPPALAPVHRAPAPQLIEPLIVPPISPLAPIDAAAIALAAQPASAPIPAPPDSLASAIANAGMVLKPDLSVDSSSTPAVAQAEPEKLPADHATDVAEANGSSPFVWPASTRLSYVLTGNYRGEVHGWAQVEWINVAPRYQVNLDVTVGLPFAPLFKREMQSDGRLDRGGLHPDHFQQQSKLAFQPLRRIGLAISDEAVIADDGRHLPKTFAAADAARTADHQTTLQDSASQFVQLSYLFTIRPQLLTPGTRIGFPLVLPGGVRDWAYEVGQKQTIHTRFGAIDAFHVKSASGLSRGRDQLLAEAWFAPRLAYLPVRLRVEQHAELYLDMILERIPELTAP